MICVYCGKTHYLGSYLLFDGKRLCSSCVNKIPREIRDMAVVAWNLNDYVQFVNHSYNRQCEFKSVFSPFILTSNFAYDNINDLYRLGSGYIYSARSISKYTLDFTPTNFKKSGENSR